MYSIFLDRNTLELEAIGSSLNSGNYQSTRRYTPQDFDLHQHLCGNLKALIVKPHFRTLFWGISMQNQRDIGQNII